MGSGSRGRCSTADFLLIFLHCHAASDCQNDLTDALPVEVGLRSWRIVRTATCQKGLTAMVNQMSPPPMVYELLWPFDASKCFFSLFSRIMPR